MGRLLTICLVACSLFGCGRYFSGPILPAPEDKQETTAKVKDDGSVSFNINRLEITLRPMSDEELNRQFPTVSKGGPLAANPYTYGDWKPVGDTYTPPKYTVFLIQVTNYEYPKVRLDPTKVELVSKQAKREYAPLVYQDILEYYYSLTQAYSGKNYQVFQERRDLLNRTLYPQSEFVFSAQERQGYLVFPALPPDLTDFEVRFYDIALRFDYKDDPIELKDLVFRFQREVFKGYEPPEDLVQK
jgi:hypothetical protein